MGYGDIVPVNDTEIAFVILAMIVGAVVFGYVAGTVGVAVNEIAAPGLRLNGKMQEVIDYLHERKVAPDLFTRTCSQYEFYLSRKSAFDEEVILSELTESLRQEVGIGVVIYSRFSWGFRGFHLLCCSRRQNTCFLAV